MPELPEVETLRRGLEQGIINQRIAAVVVANAKVLKGQSEAELRSRVEGRCVERVDRRGKYLLATLGGAAAATEADANIIPPPPQPGVPHSLLCIHLKMQGHLRLEDAALPAGPYHCVSLLLKGGRALRFYDMWAWGEMRALTPEELPVAVPALAQMGQEPLEAGWDGAALRAKLTGKKTPIKSALLDQRVVAGIGNIYADESLFRAGIRPERKASSLTDEETERLSRAVRAVLNEAINGGGSVGDYVNVEGAAGKYAPQVYDRGGAACVTCAATLSRMKLGGRGTTFCPQCQK